MSLRSLLNNLLVRVLLAIILGIGFGMFFPEWLARVFLTFNGIFSQFLGFLIPVLIVALVTPAIADLGRGAGKWLAVTAGIAYGSTVFAGLLAFLVSQATYPWLLGGRESIGSLANPEDHALSGFFEINMPPVFDVMTALILSFCVGVGITFVKGTVLHRGFSELRVIIMRIVEKIIIPLLPVYIFGMFLNLTMNGQIVVIISTFFKVVLLAFVMTVVILIIQYLVAGTVAKRNPFVMLKNMLPAYATALGTSSSAATIPVTLECTRRNGVDDRVAGFTVPLCATIHLSGSTMKIVLFSVAIMTITGMNLDPWHYVGFIFLLGVTMVAAPGVPGGAIMAAVGILQSFLGFDDTAVGLMIATYIAIDSFGTACNVTGDGAIASIMDRLLKNRRGDLEEATPTALAS